MLYKLITTPYELREEFKKYNRDYYTLNEYEAILEYFNTNHLVKLDVISICTNIVKESWEDTYKKWGNHDHNNIINALASITHVLTWDSVSILYVVY